VISFEFMKKLYGSWK